MRRRIEKEKVEKVEKDEYDTKWSFKRIAIFAGVVFTIVFFAFYFLQARSGEILGENEMSSSSDKPQIELPNENDIEEILESAEDNISNVNPNDIVNSQPQIQAAIDQLEKLVNQDNIKKSICSSLCAEN